MGNSDAELDEAVNRLEERVDQLCAAYARLDGEMGYIRRAFETRERIEADEVRAALEVRKTGALEQIREHGAEQNHRRELLLKAMALLTAIAAIVSAILGS